MATIWKEDFVTLNNLASHFEDSGLEHMELLTNRIRLFTPNGLCHSVRIDEDRKFLVLSTDLPTDKDRSRIEKLELIQRYNATLFLSSFSLDDDGDVVIDYPVCYETGLIIGQFMLVLKRFGSMIEHLVEVMNEEGLICFDQETSPDETMKDCIIVANQSDSNDPLELDESRPKNVVLN